MISLLIVIIIVLILVIWLIYNNNNIKNDINKLESEYNTNLYDEYELDDPDDEILFRWRSHANLLFSNWLNYYVYQGTPFDLNELSGGK